MNRGYIKLWRKAENSVTFSRGPLRIGVLVILLMRASWHKDAFRGKQLNPGDCAFSVVKLADELGLSRSNLNRMLDEFVADGVITRQNVDNRFTVISFVNWDTYQGFDENLGQPADNQRTISGQLMIQLADNQRTTAGTYSKKEEGRRKKRESVAPSDETCGEPRETHRLPEEGPGLLPGVAKPVKAKKRAAVTLPTSVEEVWAYIQSRESSCEAVNKMSRQEAERFFFYWDSKGWSDKSGPIKNWKSRLATWGLRSNSYDGNKNAHCGNSEHFNPFRLDA